MAFRGADDTVDTLNTLISSNGNFISSKAPINHQSTGTSYGVGTENIYGHCKTINNLNRTSFTYGEALSAYQGYLLDQKKVGTENPILTWNIANNNLPVKLRRGGESNAYELYLDVNGSIYNIVTNSGVFFKNQFDMISCVHLTSSTNEYNFLNIIFTSYNGYVTFLVNSYNLSSIINVNLNETTTKLSTDACGFATLLNIDKNIYIDSVYSIKNSEGNYRVKIAFSKYIPVFDIICIGGQVTINSVQRVSG